MSGDERACAPGHRDRGGAEATLRGCLEAIGRDGERWNALLERADDGAARARARAADARRRDGRGLGPLDGVPVVIKDNIDVAGMITTDGTAGARRAAVDSDVVARLARAGAIVLAKANMDEAALGASGDNPHHGPVRNPADPERSSGGSSGGSAAAVAAGFCAVALGTDTMGSVRLPAAHCGIVGFKPSPARTSMRGVSALHPAFDTLGVLCRTVDELLRASAVLYPHGGGRWGPGQAPRWAWLSTPGTAITPAVASAVDGVSGRLPRSWRRVPDVSLAVPLDVARRRGLLLIERHLGQAWGTLFASQPERFSNKLLALVEFGLGAPADRLAAARRTVDDAGDALRRAFADADLIVGPTVPGPAPAPGAAAADDQADLTAIANLAGCPALTLPCPVPEGASPVGLQLVAAPGRDRFLLAAAVAAEREIPRCRMLT